MEATTTVTRSYGDIGPIPLLVILAFAVISCWKIWRRTGRPDLWSILMIVPAANLISPRVLAFKKWPAVDGRESRP